MISLEGYSYNAIVCADQIRMDGAILCDLKGEKYFSGDDVLMMIVFTVTVTVHKSPITAGLNGTSNTEECPWLSGIGLCLPTRSLYRVRSVRL
jgi:hypothetical protein